MMITQLMLIAVVGWLATLPRLLLVHYISKPATDLAKQWDGWGTALKPAHEPIILARKPLEKTVFQTVEKYGTGALNIDGCLLGKERFPANCVTTGGNQWYSEYFNVKNAKEISKKASKADRNSDWRSNVIDLPVRQAGSLKMRTDGSLDGNITTNRNTHPTVKPTRLMAWLCRLVKPPGGIILDPFGGSGSTAVAAKREGFNFILIEREPEYVEIAKRRVA